MKLKQQSSQNVGGYLNPYGSNFNTSTQTAQSSYASYGRSRSLNSFVEFSKKFPPNHVYVFMYTSLTQWFTFTHCYKIKYPQFFRRLYYWAFVTTISVTSFPAGGSLNTGLSPTNSVTNTGAFTSSQQVSDCIVYHTCLFSISTLHLSIHVLGIFNIVFCADVLLFAFYWSSF